MMSCSQRSCCACSCASAVWGTLVGLSEGVGEGLLKAADLGQWAVDATRTALGITTVTDPTTTAANDKGTSHTDGAGAGRGAWSIGALFVWCQCNGLGRPRQAAPGPLAWEGRGEPTCDRCCFKQLSGFICDWLGGSRRCVLTRYHDCRCIDWNRGWP
jgi:hypothetical protein